MKEISMHEDRGNCVKKNHLTSRCHADRSKSDSQDGLSGSNSDRSWF